MWVSSSVYISGALWWIAFTAVHSFFLTRTLFFLPRLNIPIFLPILGWKYSCNSLNYSLWHCRLRMYWGINYKCLVSRSVSRYIVHVLHRCLLQPVRSRCHIRRTSAWKPWNRDLKHLIAVKSKQNDKILFHLFTWLDAKSVVDVVSNIKGVHKIRRECFSNVFWALVGSYKNFFLWIQIKLHWGRNQRSYDPTGMK